MKARYAVSAAVDPGVPHAVRKELRTRAFALGIDLMLSDGRLSPKEEAFADDLRTLLNVDSDSATTKNSLESERMAHVLPETIIDDSRAPAHSRAIETPVRSTAELAAGGRAVDP